MRQLLALLCLLLLASPALADETVRVSILSRHAPRWIEIRGPTQLLVRAGAAGLLVDGVPRDRIALQPARWALRGAGFRRVYDGSLELRQERGAIAVWIDQPLEAYVADVVAAESEPGTPPAALRALAVVVRSYAVAGADRHEAGGRCDLAHCQITFGRRSDAAAARAAAAATAGQVLRLADGSVALAPFHASCGGRTASPAALFGGVDRSGAAPVTDPGCSAPWEALLPTAAVEAAIAEAFGVPAPLARLRRHGESRWVDPATGRFASAEGFARALDRRAGWGVVRSPRFDFVPGGGAVRLRGRGHGHGAGLCQAGAAALARAGSNHAAILAHYFPNARLR
ncbi:SpoIID/LytB domain-containing protein [Vulgatibacter sp.]|uniref:SpoIID/LytB domain-containing protein n=1 Tax=Vulgatibacter sp. TaxID=1971226 RepID=UPI003567C387